MRPNPCLPAALLATACLTSLAPRAAAQEENPMHLTTSFDVVVAAPYERTAALFTPEGERAWAGKHWNPQYIFKGDSGDDSVFTIDHGAWKAVWVVCSHDLAARHFQYVYFIADLLVTKIDVRFASPDPGTTKVHVTYERTAVRPEGKEHVAALTEQDRAAGKEWQAAIDRYLETQIHSPKP